MIRKCMKLSAMPLLAAALWLAGCSDQSVPADGLLGPDAAAFAKGGNGQGTGGGNDKTTGPRVREQRQDGVVKEWKIATGKLPEATEVKAEQVIGYEGGILYTASHALVVPKGAVKQPTTFKIQASRTPVEGDSIVAVEVSLKATYVDADGVTIDVGEQGFATPVYLALSYSWAREVMDPSQASILWLTAPGVGEEVSTHTVDYNGKWIVGQLQHFSDYALVMP